MEGINKEELIENSPIPVSIKGTENILFQMKNSICKIYTKNNKKGTGFFLKISFINKIFYFLVTNYHVLEDLKNNDKIEITRNNDNISNDIILNNKRKIYKYKEIDVILIKINPKDDKINENEFLEIDEDINKDIKIIEKEYRKKSVYILHYPHGEDSKVSYGLLNGINNENIKHYCNTQKGSSGSPIISLKNNKVIGIHRGSPKNDKFQFNKGILYQDIINENNNKTNNEIQLKIKIEEKYINKKIYFLDNTDNKYYINGKFEEHHHDFLKELNESNTEIFINNNKYNYKKYFVPKKEGIYDIIIKLNIKMKDCSFMFCECNFLTEINLSSFESKDVNNTSYMFYGCDNLSDINLSTFNTKKSQKWDLCFANVLI